MDERGVYNIKIVEGNNQGETVRLEDDVVSLGSGTAFAANVDRIDFADSSMSREHAVFMWQKKDNNYIISNRSPIHPIMVNGSPCGHALLTPGMKIKIGNTTLEVSIENFHGKSEAVAAPAALPKMDDLYLGERPDTQAPRIGTPAWLLKGPVPASVDKPAAVSEAVTAQEPAAVVHVSDSITVQDAAAPAELSPAEEQAAAGAAPKLLGQIQVVKGANKGECLDVYGDISIGRLPECDLTLSDAQVSRQHCSITFEGGVAYITPLSASNTTKVGRSNIKDKTELPIDADITLASRVLLKWTALY